MFSVQFTAHSVQCTVYCYTQCQCPVCYIYTVFSVQFTAHSVQFTVYTVLAVYTQCWVYSLLYIQCWLYIHSVKCKVYCIYSFDCIHTVLSVQFTIYTQCWVHSLLYIQCWLYIHSVECIVYCIYSVYCIYTVLSVQFTVYTVLDVQCTVCNSVYNVK